jgi:4-hydroxyphenylpyruvate dioxygenase-like putative hemolysin
MIKLMLGLLRFRPDTGLKFIDHLVGNMPDNEMETTAQWYI